MKVLSAWWVHSEHGVMAAVTCPSCLAADHRRQNVSIQPLPCLLGDLGEAMLQLWASVSPFVS